MVLLTFTSIAKEIKSKSSSNVYVLQAEMTITDGEDNVIDKGS